MNKIRVRDIRPEGLEVKDVIDTSVLGLGEEDPIVFIAPLKIKADIEKVENTILARTSVQGKFTSMCARCLEPLDRNLEQKYFLDFPVSKTTEYIDIEEDIRQEILLNLPARILCKENCQGLCKGCGVNLNKEKCKCGT